MRLCPFVFHLGHMPAIAVRSRDRALRATIASGTRPLRVASARRRVRAARDLGTTRDDSCGALERAYFFFLAGAGAFAGAFAAGLAAGAFAAAGFAAGAFAAGPFAAGALAAGFAVGAFAGAFAGAAGAAGLAGAPAGFAGAGAGL